MSNGNDRYTNATLDIDEILSADQLVLDRASDTVLMVKSRAGGVVRGESGRTDDGGVPLIDVVGWKWGATVMEFAGQGRRGQFTPHGLWVVKRVDAASPALMNLAKSCQLDLDVELRLFKVGGAAGVQDLMFLKIALGRAGINNVVPYTSSRTGELLEIVRFKFLTVEYVYTPQQQTGQRAGAVTFRWSEQG